MQSTGRKHWPQTFHGRRWTAAAALLLAGTSSHPQQVNTSLRIDAVVAPRVTVRAEAPTILWINEQDLARGFVEVSTPTNAAVSSNGAFGVLLELRVPRGLFTSVRMQGDLNAELPGEGGTVTLQWIAPASGGSRLLKWTYRFGLDPTLPAGRYDWPVQVLGQAMIGQEAGTEARRLQ